MPIYTVPKDVFTKRVNERLSDISEKTMQDIWILGVPSDYSAVHKHFVEKYEKDVEFREQINSAVRLELYQNNPDALKKIQDRIKKHKIEPYDFSNLKKRELPKEIMDIITNSTDNKFNRNAGVSASVSASASVSSSFSGNFSVASTIGTVNEKIIIDDTPLTATDSALPNSPADFAPANVSQSLEYAIKTTKNPQIPYGDLNRILNENNSISNQLKQVCTLDEVVLHVNRPGTKATIKLYNFDSQTVVDFPLFILRSFNIHMEQKSQIYEAFDTNIIYLFGEKPAIVEFVLSLYDMRNADWFRSFYKQYVDKFSGYAAASKRLITYISVNDILFEGVMLRFLPKKDLESNEIVHAGLTMVLTGLEFLSSYDDRAQSPSAAANQALTQNQVDLQTTKAANEAVKESVISYEEKISDTVFSAMAAASGVGLSILQNDYLKSALKSAKELSEKSSNIHASADYKVYGSSWVSTGLSTKIFSNVGTSAQLTPNSKISKIAGISTKIA